MAGNNAEYGTKNYQAALDAWNREQPAPDRISPAGRQRILRETANAPGIRILPRLSSLFPAYHRFALAAAVPAGLLALIVAFSLGGSTGPAAITVEKAGNQVVFKIANGGKVHSVSKSNTPHSFDPAHAVQVRNGSYRDSMVENGDLVFYRID